MTQPALIRDADLTWEPYPALEGSFRIKRSLSRRAQGSELGMGVCELQPGQSTVWWSFIDDDPDGRVAMAFGAASHEAYFVLDGRFTFHWQDRDGVANQAEAGPGDSFYFAPGARQQGSCGPWRLRRNRAGSFAAGCAHQTGS